MVAVAVGISLGNSCYRALIALLIPSILVASEVGSGQLRRQADNPGRQDGPRFQRGGASATFVTSEVAGFSQAMPEGKEKQRA